MDATIARLARNVTRLRQGARLTQEELGARSGVHPTEVSRIEKGERDVRVSTVGRLAQALDVRPSELLDG